MQVCGAQCGACWVLRAMRHPCRCRPGRPGCEGGPGAPGWRRPPRRGGRRAGWPAVRRTETTSIHRRWQVALQRSQQRMHTGRWEVGQHQGDQSSRGMAWEGRQPVPFGFNIESPFPCDPASPLLGIDSKELKPGRPTGTCQGMFMALPFATATKWEQPQAHQQTHG